MFVRILLLLLSLAVHSAGAEVSNPLAELEKKHGGRLGVAALDTGNGKRIEHRADERFALCSTFKFLLAAAVLDRVDAGGESLDRELSYGEDDLLGWAPITKKHVENGAMSVGGLCAAAVQYSDNTAANLLLPTVGGPEGFTRWLRSIGDPTTRLDRNEPELNTNLPDDPRDTTTPSAMVATMNELLVGDVLSAESREKLAEWLIGNTTGDNRLRAGLPSSATVGDKTGTGERGAANDVAIAWPQEGGAPWLIAVYYVDPDAEPAERDAVIAEAGRIVAEEFAATDESRN